MSLLCLLREDFTRNQVLYSCTHEEVIKIHLDGEREREIHGGAEYKDDSARDNGRTKRTFTAKEDCY